MNPFTKDVGEWLAHEALEAAGGDFALARRRIMHADMALALWSVTRFFDVDEEDQADG
jgi:hypothetical protein